MRLLPLFLLLCTVSYGQSTVSRDTLTNDHEEIEISFSVTGDFANIELITIQHFSVVGSDTISVFVGAYDVNEDDPSDFLTFSLDEVAEEFLLGIGSFSPTQLYSKVIITKSVGLPEEFLIN